MLDDDYELTPRELEATALIAQGDGIKGTARQMKVSYFTVKHYLHRARIVTGAPTTPNLIYRLMRKGLIR